MARRVPYLLVDAFTETPDTGNRAGIVLDASELSDLEMQRVAEILQVSETVFVTYRAGNEVGVRYFTPSTEVNFCGHATLALAFILTSHVAGSRMFESGIGIVWTLATKAGRIPVELEFHYGALHKAWMHQPEPRFRPLLQDAQRAIAEALGIDGRMIHRGLPAAIASTGLWSAFLPLVDTAVLDGLDPDFVALENISRELDIASIHPYAPTSPTTFAARDFAPIVGILEDPVTGSANGALAVLLARAGVLPKHPTRMGFESELRIRQGHVLGFPGEVHVIIEYVPGGWQVRVGGCAVTAFEGSMLLKLS